MLINILLKITFIPEQDLGKWEIEWTYLMERVGVQKKGLGAGWVWGSRPRRQGE